METKTERKQLPKLLRVLFFDTSGGNIIERVIHKSVQDYSRMFLYSGLVTHCAVALGDTYYEVSMEGTYKAPFDESMLLWENTIAYYQISLEGMSEDSIESARFMLDYDANVERKFDVWGCATYLENYVRMGVDAWTVKHGILPYVNYNLPAGTFKRKMNDMGFCLPFTCATQVANVFNALFEIEPAYDCLLPEAMFFNCEQLALADYGEFYARDYLGVN